MKTLNKLPIKITALIFYCCVLLVVCYSSFRKPEYNWDMLPYMAVAISYDNPQANTHTQVYSTIKKEVPEYAYKQLTDSSVKAKYDAFISPEEFKAQMPFYVVKPLYTRLIYGFHKAGFSLSKSTILPSVLAYFFIGLLLMIWLHQYTGFISSVILSTIIMLLPPFQQLAKLSTPDAISALAVFVGVYFILHKQKILIGCIVLVLSIFIRIDNAIFSALLLPFLWYTDLLPKQWNISRVLLFIGATILSYLAVTALASSYGWGLLYYNSFSKHMNDENNFHKAFSLGSYFKLIKKQVVIRISSSYLPVFIFMAALITTQIKVWKKGAWIKEQVLPIFCVAVMVIRFFLQPSVSDRFYIPYYLIILVCLIGLLNKQQEKELNPHA